mgnify:CR=1 FL=1
MKIKIIPLAVVTLAAFTFGIAGASALGYWITESKKEPAKVASGEFAGQADPADIRGSYSFGDVEKAFGVPAAVLADAFGFTDRPAAEVKAKDLETLYAGKTGALEVGTDAVRLFTAAWIGMPYEPEADTGLPARAVELLEGRALHPATAALVRSRIVGALPAIGTLSAAPSQPASQPASAPAPSTPAAPAPAAPPVPAAPAATPSAPGSGTAPAATDTHIAEAAAAREVKGSTTFGDLSTWGLSRAQIKEALGGRDPGAATEKVRDFCIAAGVEFSTVKAKLQEMASALPKP